jgi:tetratricopeptide (TPR) repeat protein
MLLRYLIFILIFVMSGCASIPLQKARMDFFSGHPSEADKTLGECMEIPERDRLLCYMEKGLILHYMGMYEKSTNTLLKASQFVNDQDYISVKDQSTAVMINDRTITYKGEYSERLWIHTYLMINFLLQGRPDSALVEAKQALEVFDKYPDPLEGDLFTRALIALCFESMNQPDSARIEYEKLEKAAGNKIMRPAPVAPGKGELVLFIAQGRIPAKVSADIVLPPSIRISVPRYEASYSYPPLDIKVDNSLTYPYIVKTDMGDVARESLDKRAAQYHFKSGQKGRCKGGIAQKSVVEKMNLQR